MRLVRLFEIQQASTNVIEVFLTNSKKAPKWRKINKMALHIAKNTFSHFPGERREGLYTLAPQRVPIGK